MSCRRGRRGLEVLQACTRLLMREIGTESLANGLEVSVQVGEEQRGGTTVCDDFKEMLLRRVALPPCHDV